MVMQNVSFSFEKINVIVACLRRSTVAAASKKEKMITSTHNLLLSSLIKKVVHLMLSRINKLDRDILSPVCPLRTCDIAFIPSVLKRVQRWRVSWIRSYYCNAFPFSFHSLQVYLLHFCRKFRKSLSLFKVLSLFCCKQQIYCCNQRFQTVFFNICSYTYARSKSIAKIQQLWWERILLNYNSIERKYLPDDCLQRSLCLMHDQLVIVQL